MNKTTKWVFLTLLSLLAVGTQRAWGDSGTKQTLFSTSTSSVYRIPAIVRLPSGNLWAFCDLRHDNNGNDLGSSHVIDVVGKKSNDNGSTWGSQQYVAQGTGNSSDGYNFAHGDPAAVVDRETGHILVLSASGTAGWNSSDGNPKIARSLSTDGGTNWSISEITSQLYVDGFNPKSIFFSSGRIIQSTLVKKGSYYRLYAAVNTYNNGSCVVYSDDFGETWSYLGGTSARPAQAGDECKVEELPNGNILLCCRVRNGAGRIFNIFTFTDKESATGSWGSSVTSGSSNTSGQTYAASCNGEIMLVPAKRTSDNKRMYVLLLSAAMSSNRENVGIYYKALSAETDYDAPSDFQSGWSKYAVSTTTSCYSTMTLDQNGTVDFIFEENEKKLGTGTAYDINFLPLSLATITNNQYTFSSAPSTSYRTTAEPAAVAEEETVTLPTFSVAGGTYNDAQSVELTAADGCTIYYTTDGNQPTTSSTRYSGAITISQTTVLKAIAVDSEGNESAVASAVYSIVPTTDKTSKVGTTISLDNSSSHSLFASNAGGGGYFGFLRHDVAHVQVISSNKKDLSANGDSLFSSVDNNMIFTEVDGTKYLSVNTNSSQDSVLIQVVAPKGYRFTRYQMEFLTSSCADGSSVTQYTYDADGNFVVVDTKATADGSWDKTLANGTNVLYFRFDVNAVSSAIVLKSLHVTYVIDQPIAGQVPATDGSLTMHTGLLDLGTFSNNSSSVWSFDLEGVTDLQAATLVNSDGTAQTDTYQTSDGQYFVLTANGDYYLEAPQKFRIVGATLNFLRYGLQTSGDYTDVTSMAAGDYIITDGTNYLNLSDGSITNGTSADDATVWTVSQSGTSWNIKSGDYYLVLTTSQSSQGPGGSRTTYGVGASTTLSNGNWIWDSDNHCFKGSSSSSNPHYIAYVSTTTGWGWEQSTTTQWGISESSHAKVQQKQQVSASDFTAMVYNRENTAAATNGTTQLTETNSSATVVVSDYNNDAIHFSISGLADGACALYNVNLQMMPLNPEVQKLQVAAKIGDNTVVGTNEVTSTNYTFHNGEAVPVLVPKGTTQPTIVFRNAENEEKTLWYTQGVNNNNLASSGGYSNYSLVGSTAFDANDGLSTDATPYPGARVNADVAGTIKLLATNIDDVANGNATTLQDRDYKKGDGGLATVNPEVGTAKEVYIYSADMPTWNILPSDIGSGQRHIDFRFYTITVKPVEDNETPSVTVTPLYTTTMKGAPHKSGSSLASDGNNVDQTHTYVGISVSSTTSDGTTPTGVLTNKEVIEAIKDKLQTDGYYGFGAADALRGILYVDMSGLTTVTSETDDDGNDYWNAFHAGTADNCLYFMPVGFTRKVENTVALKANNTYEATGDIRVYDQQPFFTPHAFGTGTLRAIYEREGTVDGSSVKATVKNMTAVLPFSVSLDGSGNLKAAGDAVDNTVTFHDITGYGAKNSDPYTYAFVAQNVTDGTAVANKPYYVTTSNEGFTFEIAGAQFAQTPDISTTETLTRTQDDWTAVGSYNGGQQTKGKGLWYFAQDLFWNSEKLTTNDHFNIRPFRAFYRTTDGTASAAKAAVVFDADDVTPTGISDAVADTDGLAVSAARGTITVAAGTATRYAAYTAGGQLVATGQLAAGERRTLAVPAGVYVVNTQKVVVR